MDSLTELVRLLAETAPQEGTAPHGVLGPAPGSYRRSGSAASMAAINLVFAGMMALMSAMVAVPMVLLPADSGMSWADAAQLAGLMNLATLAILGYWFFARLRKTLEADTSGVRLRIGSRTWWDVPWRDLREISSSPAPANRLSLRTRDRVRIVSDSAHLETDDVYDSFRALAAMARARGVLVSDPGGWLGDPERAKTRTALSRIIALEAMSRAFDAWD